MAEIAMRLPLKVRYNGGVAAEGLLPLYDGTTAIAGIAQVVQIATHALLTERIVTRATAAKRATFYFLPAKSGSYLTEMVALVEQSTVALGIITAPVFYDFIKTVLKKATSAEMPVPETSAIRRWMDRDEPFFDELAETLEGSLQRSHRPIGEGVETITIERPRSELLAFNAATKLWVNTRETAENTSSFTGCITRFNSITRNGRAFIDQLGRVLPVKPADDFIMAGLSYLTWSLHGSANRLPKELAIDAREIKSASGETKRLLLVDCSRSPA